MFGQYETTLMNSFMFKCDGVKKQGNAFEFQEFLACVWLEYLLKIGYHDNTFSNSNLAMRLKQFDSLITKDSNYDAPSMNDTATSGHDQLKSPLIPQNL